MNQVRKTFSRFRAWQRNPYTYTAVSRKAHRCLNCGHDYEGNYCPRCGQAADTGRLGWRVVWEKIIDVWDVEQRSLPLTLWFLIWRPGYMIRDYLDGRRQLCYSPVMLLFMLGIAVTILNLFPSSESDFTPSGDSVTLDAFMKWEKMNVGWGFIILNSFLILPTWIVFRYSPLHSRHTLPEGFFIQMFMGSLMLFTDLLENVLHLDGHLTFLLVFFFLFGYGPVFGYNAWGTIWRFVICIYSSLTNIIITALCVDVIVGNPLTKDYVMRSSVQFCTSVALVILAFFISRRTERLRKAKAPVTDPSIDDIGWKAQFTERKRRKKRRMRKLKSTLG
ncbi:MAG: DUF3667 domain-containing protein [Prevotella sp.]|nr:DUF3667 domain-containing protein [Prevotella sp.]